MPTSFMESVTEIISEAVKYKPASLLDAGIGFGKYGVLLRERLELPFERYEKSSWKTRIDGIEAFENYRNPIHDYVYDHVYYEPVESCIESLPEYDVVLLIDVLEHFEKEEGNKLIKKLLNHTKEALIISTPLYPDTQGNYLGNTFEEHKSRWTQLDFADFDFDYKLLRIGKNGAQIFIIQPPKGQPKEFLIDKIQLLPQKNEDKKLTIGYFLPHKNMTGGLKMLLEQMKHLRKKGHKIYAFYRGDEDDTALPEWMELQVDKEIVIPGTYPFSSYASDIDVGVAGWLSQTMEFSNTGIPVVYWEQGNEYLFGEGLSMPWRLYLQDCYQQKVALASVSPLISRILQARYGRKTTVIPNGVDTDFYFPGRRPNENIVLLVGNPNLSFKGFDVAIQTLIRVWKNGQKFKLRWVCQTKPALDHVPFPFPIEYIVMPSQEELARCYRESDLFLFTSWYEGFGMPPLEAMASGLPVVSTSCGGIEVYAKNGVNAILAEPGDIDGLAKGVLKLLADDIARNDLSKKGRETAMNFSASKISNQLEEYLYQLVSYYKKD